MKLYGFAPTRTIRALWMLRALDLGWLKCVSGSRALLLTSSGRAGLSEIFQIEINNRVSQPVDYPTHDG